MGLDITAYKNLKLLPNAVYDENTGDVVDKTTRECPKNWYMPSRNHEAHASRADGLNGIFSYEDFMGFRAGSYSGYGMWREELAKLAGWPAIPHDTSFFSSTPRIENKHAPSAWEAEEGPFWELINFSDCEGTIGPVTSAKLAKDFESHQHLVDGLTLGSDEDTEWFRERYADWRAAFEMAAMSGAVSLH